MIQHVVQHAVRLKARLRPILGIQASGRCIHDRHVIHLGALGSRPNALSQPAAPRSFYAQAVAEHRIFMVEQGGHAPWKLSSG